MNAYYVYSPQIKGPTLHSAMVNCVQVGYDKNDLREQWIDKAYIIYGELSKQTLIDKLKKLGDQLVE